MARDSRCAARNPREFPENARKAHRPFPVIFTADVADGRRYQTRKPTINVKKVDLSQKVIGAAMKQSDLSRTSSLLNHR